MRVLVLLLAVVPTTLLAEIFVVTKEADDSGACSPQDCSLREAILAANAFPGLDEVVVPNGIYPLTLSGPVPEQDSLTGDLDIRDDLELRGESARTVIVIGDGTDRVIDVQSPTRSVAITGLTLTGGYGPGPGGGISVTGVSTGSLRDVAVTSSTSLSGPGGGLYIAAIDTLTLENVTLAGNDCPTNRGGGASIWAISVSDFVNLTNVTVSANTAEGGGGLHLFGPGFYDLRNVTIVDNTAPIVDGVLGDISTRLTYSNVLLANNGCGYIGGVVPFSNDHNMEGPTDSCFVPGSGDSRGVLNLLLGPLADNGGPTQTHALLAGSPAVDTALDADCPPTDQRGTTRPIDGDGSGSAACDIGAFERLASPNPLPIPTSSRLGLALMAIALAFLAASRIGATETERKAAKLRF